MSDTPFTNNMENKKERAVLCGLAAACFAPGESSNDFCHCLVLHGRAVCDARKPLCERCCVRHLCQHFSG